MSGTLGTAAFLMTVRMEGRRIMRGKEGRGEEAVEIVYLSALSG
jgi:hypothetical protein